MGRSVRGGEDGEAAGEWAYGFLVPHLTMSRRAGAAFLIAVSLLVTAAASGADEAHRAEAADTLRSGQVPAAPYEMPPLREALFAEMHSKIVHFPIVLALGGALLLILARRKPELEPVAFWTVWAAALGALAAYFSGVFMAEEFKGEPKEWLVALHQRWGIAVGLAQAVWVLLLLRKPAKRYAWIWGLVVVALVGVAAFLGGEVAHGE